METIVQSTEISASPGKVYEAIKTTEGNRGWWTRDCEVGQAVGDRAVFRFDAGKTVMKFRVDALEPGHLVEWTCTGHEGNPEWQGTKVSFRLIPTGAGTRVDFAHTGWREKSRCYEMCVGGWTHFMGSLKSYVETGAGTPHGK